MNRGTGEPLDDEIFDRLVDGELHDDEYRELLSSLDSQTDGWRRCALAFLEAQAWGQDLRALRNESRQTLDTKPAPARWTWTYGGLLSLASAASLLLAFVIAAQVIHSPAQRTAFPTQPGLGNLANDLGSNPRSGPRDLDPSFASVSPGGQPWGQYRLVVDGQDGQPREIEMPIYAADDPRAKTLLTGDDNPTIPVELIRAFQHMGYRVDRERQWAPVQHESGDVLVPIEQLQITPVSSRSYQ